MEMESEGGTSKASTLWIPPALQHLLLALASLAPTCLATQLSLSPSRLLTLSGSFAVLPAHPILKRCFVVFCRGREGVTKKGRNGEWESITLYGSHHASPPPPAPPPPLHQPHCPTHCSPVSLPGEHCRSLLSPASSSPLGDMGPVSELAP